MRSSIISALLASVLSGCTNLFLQPSRALFVKPDLVGANWEEARFASSDGTGLTGLWFPSARTPAKGVVVQFHGNAENMTSHFLSVWWLALEGWHVLAFDYRGYGASAGKKGLSGSVADGAAALTYARSRAPGLPIAVVGQSLGGVIALAALERDGGDGVFALTLDSVFASFVGIARDKLGLWWATRWLRGPLAHLLVSDRYRPTRLAARRRPIPLVVLHSPGDRVVPYEHGRILYKSAAGPKEWWEVSGDGHADAFTARGAEFRPRLAAFLDEALPRP
ncbi:MAG: alpha/beta fold hydrolase [Elusimicrobia bacterium]|nr:alpha/beta fold hydrolase [Elusimicrobiota bacterium]